MDATPTLPWSTRPCAGDLVPPVSVSPDRIKMPGANAAPFAFAVR